MKKFKSFKNNENYEILGEIRLVPTEEECAKVRAKQPYLRICLDCHAPIIAGQFQCHICSGENLKVISKD
jgi:hypothetical protein